MLLSNSPPSEPALVTCMWGEGRGERGEGRGEREGERGEGRGINPLDSSWMHRWNVKVNGGKYAPKVSLSPCPPPPLPRSSSPLPHPSPSLLLYSPSISLSSSLHFPDYDIEPINKRWRFNRYNKGNFFRPHFDAGFVVLSSILLFLSFLFSSPLSLLLSTSNLTY